MIDPPSDEEHGLTAAQVAGRLGVDRSTVYAYASRGSLRRWRDADGRRSRYDPRDVEELAARARPRSARRRPASVEIEIEIGTTISEVGDGWVRYRSHRLDELAATRSFEEVVSLLWFGDDGGAVTPSADRIGPVRSAVRRAVATLSPAARPSTRISVGVAGAAAAIDALGADPGAPGSDVRREDPRPLLLDAMIESLLPVTPGDRADNGSIAERMWARCSARRSTPDRLAALETAMTLLAEHQLSTSTLAVRVAASGRARPPSALLVGIATATGTGASVADEVHRRLLGDPDADPLAGVGHCIHESGDPREATLASALEAMTSRHQRRRIDVDRQRLVDRTATPPNVDLALGGLAYAAGLAPGLTEAIFVVARGAGWLAHVYEEYDETPRRFRGRGVSRGPRR